MVLRIRAENHNPGLCRWCIKPTAGTHVVSRQDWAYRWVSDYACPICAEGWREIGDRNNDLVI